jgi:hypothetical protein
MKQKTLDKNTKNVLKLKLIELHQSNKIDLKELIDEAEGTINLDAIIGKLK